MLMMFVSLKAESEDVIFNFPVVCEFRDVFPYDGDLPPDREF